MKYTIVYKKVRHGYVRINNDGRLQITIPTSLQNNKKFEQNLLEKAKLLRSRYQQKQQMHTEDSNSITLFGEKVSRTEIFGTKKYSQATETKKLKQILFDYVEVCCDQYAKQICFDYKDITIKKLKARRGSCSYDQRLVFNLQLLHLPTACIKYVAAHEICHLKVKNHSAKFWKEVELIFPTYKQVRKQMRNFILTSSPCQNSNPIDSENL